MNTYIDSLETCIELADAGDSAAQYYLGATYCGYGFPISPIKINYEIAKEWYVKSAEQGHMDAQYYAGRLYHWHLIEYSKAIFWFRKSAEQGHLEAMEYLAEALQKNIKKQKILANYSESIFWYEKILSIKNIDINEENLEIEESLVSSVEHIFERLANIYLNAKDKEIQNVEKAFEILEKIEEKSLYIYSYVIDLYLNFNDERTYNLEKAIFMLEKKAHVSISLSFLLGKLYAGEGSEYPKEIENFCKAETLFHHCIEGHMIQAINSLFLLYKKQDKHIEAFHLLYNSYEKIEMLEKRRKKIERLYEEKGSDLDDLKNGNLFCYQESDYCKLLTNLSICYEKGLGTDVDIINAKKMLRKSKKVNFY